MTARAMEEHKHFMRVGVSYARRGIGRTAPNPSVGCVLVKDGVIIAAARTADGGRPHAEKVALDAAGEQASGATAYVTLAPCTHHGKTPPCTDALIAAGVARVVIGAEDVDPRVKGNSAKTLRDAGVDVIDGVLEEECAALNAGFFSAIEQGRPYVTLKSACSLDGKVALKNGQSQWITGVLARRHTHLMRARHDAILVGIETALADDPSLTARVDGLSHTIKRVVLDRNLRLPPKSALALSVMENLVLVFYEQDNDNNYSALQKAGVHCIRVDDCSDIGFILKTLVQHDVTRLFVEGGARVHASFLASGSCDELLLYRAPCVLGAECKSVFGDLGVQDLQDRFEFEQISTQKLGADMLERYQPKAK